MNYTEKDKKFMADARAFATNHSKDRSTKVGALILGKEKEPLSWGYNGFPRGVNDNKEDRHQRPVKYMWSEHAERNAIYNAARAGIRLRGAHIYVTSLPPCTDCARAIIQSGISTVFLEAKAFDTTNERSKAWLENWPVALEMFREGKVEIVILDDEPVS